MATLILTLLINGSIARQVEIGFSTRDYCEKVAQVLYLRHQEFRANGTTPYDEVIATCKREN